MINGQFVSMRPAAGSPMWVPPPGPGHGGPWEAVLPPSAFPPGSPVPPPPGVPPPPSAVWEMVQQWVADNQLDEAAREQILAQPPDVQQAVIARGRLTGRNPSSVLMSRIRSVADELRHSGAPPGQPPAPRQPPPPWEPPPPFEPPARGFGARGASPSPLYDPFEGWGDKGCGAAPLSPLSRFAKENGLDELSELQLRGEAPEVQRDVIREGPLEVEPGSDKDAGAVLLDRILRVVEERALADHGRQLEEEEQLRRSQDVDLLDPRSLDDGPFGGRPDAYAIAEERQRRRGARSRSPGGAPGHAIEDFAARNGLDAGSVAALREAPPHVQAKVMDDGPVTGRNPNAILMSRIRKFSAAALSFEDLGAQLDAFCVENGLDEDMAHNLRSQLDEVQLAVLAKGKLTGRDPAAVLNSRIRSVLGGSGRQPQASSRQPPPSRHAPAARGSVAAIGAPIGAPVGRQAATASPPARRAPPRGALPPEEPRPTKAARMVVAAPGRGISPRRAPAREPYARDAPAPARAEPRRRGGRDPLGPDFVERFLAQNEVDGASEVARALREAPESVQRLVVDDGRLTGRNPTAVLYSRMKRHGHHT